MVTHRLIEAALKKMSGRNEIKEDEPEGQFRRPRKPHEKHLCEACEKGMCVYKKKAK